jgi:hypothetical protein
VPANYEPVDGSTPTTRKQAYNAFISNLDGYGLIKEGEDTAHVTELDYYYVELSSSLAQALVNKYYDELKEDAIDKLAGEDKQYTQVKEKYENIMQAQKLAYEDDAAAFETALGSLADDSFVLYGKAGFGFVYNILIPFSASQSQAYAAAKSKNLKEAELFDARKEILEGVQAQDLRGAWFCDDIEADDHYAYEKNGQYYFFEDNFTNAGEGKEYKELTQYAGNLPFQGTATYDKAEEEWTVKANKTAVTYSEEVGKDGSFIDLFEGYVAQESGATLKHAVQNPTYGKGYYLGEDDRPTNEKTDRVNYMSFIYYAGQFDLGETNNSDYFKRGTTAYKAVSAVNEIMFAYSTDTGCLNKYMGYAVSPYKTNFVPEFEYAAQMTVAQGAGTYSLVATDYGWHLIYCSFKYDDGAVYGETFNTANVEEEGTFEYMFYESLKSTAAANYTTAEQSKVLNEYKDSVSLHKNRYQDLLDIGK